MQKNTSITLANILMLSSQNSSKMADTAQPAKSFVQGCACLKSPKPA